MKLEMTSAALDLNQDINWILFMQISFTSIICRFCMWSKITDVSRKMMSNILQHLQITNPTYPLRTATAETNWEHSLLLLLVSPFHLVQLIYIYMYIYNIINIVYIIYNIYIHIFIYIYILYILYICYIWLQLLKIKQLITYYNSVIQSCWKMFC